MLVWEEAGEEEREAVDVLLCEGVSPFELFSFKRFLLVFWVGNWKQQLGFGVFLL